MAESMKPTMIQIPPSLLSRLDERMVAEQRSRSDLIREAIAAFLDDAIDGDLERRYRRAYAEGADVDAWGDVQGWHDALAAVRHRGSTS
jgi:metal-responsive CopG/Arc/MetJ family transcriptional regulator